MKRFHVVIAIPALFLSGCYNLVVINIGVANKSAAAIAAPFDIEAFCAALANHSLRLDLGEKAQLEQETERLCENIAKKEGKP